ncbi:MAG: hypothetical protein NDJ18_07220 [candidate division Zixibacteria bacterium]|nr:hypothetical protein [candidate division Zixibacteria bacterium]
MRVFNIGIGRAILFSIVGFVIVAAGVGAGVFVANKYLQPKVKFADPLASLTKVIEVGESSPTLRARNPNGQHELVTLAHGDRELLVAFLSGDCDPCYEAARALVEDPAIREGRAQLLLFALDPSRFARADQQLIWQISPEELQRLDIRLFPTFVRVNQDGLVKAIQGTYTPELLNKFLFGL